MTENGSKRMAELLEDYATKPVPPSISSSGFRIALISTSMAFSLPALLTGVQLGMAVGFERSVSAFLIGNLILAVIGTVVGLVGVKNRLSTYMILRFPFGLKGANLVNLCISLSMFGWFGVNVYLFGQAASGLWLSITGITVGQWVFVLIGGILMTGGAIFGFKSVQKLSVLVVPIQLLILVFLLNKIFVNSSIAELINLSQAVELSQGEAISAVVGGLIVAVVVMPDFTRYGKTWKDSLLASFIPYLFATSISYMVSASAATWTGESDVLALMIAVGLGFFAFVMVIVSSWITNALNLYGCSLSISSLLPRFKEWQIVVICGAAGTIIAFFGILEHFIDFIFSLGIIFTPIAAIYVIDFFIINRGCYPVEDVDRDTGVSYVAILAWLLGICVAYSADKGLLEITSIASCDALIVSAVAYWSLIKIKLSWESRKHADMKI